MCVVAMAWKAHPKWRLLVAGNRDEFHARASAPLAIWDSNVAVMAGRDLVSGGSWMGVSDTGRFAVVTNIRDADGPDLAKTSRGALVAGWLSGGNIPEDVADFNPFSLIVSDNQSAQFISNRPGQTRNALAAGIHGLSNAIPNELWPRKDRVVAKLANWLAGPVEQPEILLDMLGDDEVRDSDSYPVFIRSPVYGTRCSTVVAVDQAGQGRIIERRFSADGISTGETTLRFAWPH